MQALFLLLLLSSVGLIMPKLKCSDGGAKPCINNKDCPPQMTCIENKPGGPVCCNDAAIVPMKNAKGN
ncbi:unnamed protein product [Cylicocyclus nassatus]|nr:unnamed protein product [Cylicocyclus nassatus]